MAKRKYKFRVEDAQGTRVVELWAKSATRAERDIERVAEKSSLRVLERL